MKNHVLISVLFILLTIILTGCSKTVYGINLLSIVIPLAIILAVAIGIVIVKNYKSMAEEKQLIAEMARREQMFAAEEAERQKKLAAEEAEKDKQQ